MKGDIERYVLAWMCEAHKWTLVYTEDVLRAFEEQYSREQIKNAVRRLARARKIEYVGKRSSGYWRVK